MRHQVPLARQLTLTTGQVASHQWEGLVGGDRQVVLCKVHLDAKTPLAYRLVSGKVASVVMYLAASDLPSAAINKS